MLPNCWDTVFMKLWPWLEANIWQKHAQTGISNTHRLRCAYVEVWDVVLQQDLNVPNALLSPNKGEGDHSLCRQNTKSTTHMLIWAWLKPESKTGVWRHSTHSQLHQLRTTGCSSRLTSCRGCLLSLSPSILTLTTPDLSTISWMTFPFLPITLPAHTQQEESW